MSFNNNFDNINPTITIHNDFIEYEILWYKKIFLSHSFFNLIKDSHYKISTSSLWEYSKHLLSQDELNIYFNTKNINITVKDIKNVIFNFIFKTQLSIESVLFILTSNTEYLNNANIQYDRHIHSITYFWLIFISGSIIYFENYNKDFDDYNQIKDKWEKNYHKYKKIFDTLYDFGKLKRNNNIYDYPDYPSQQIINKIKNTDSVSTE